MEDRLLTTEEVAIILRCSTRHVCKLLGEQSLPGIKMGKRYLVPAEALKAWIRTNCKAKDMSLTKDL